MDMLTPLLNEDSDCEEQVQTANIKNGLLPRTGTAGKDTNDVTAPPTAFGEATSVVVATPKVCGGSTTTTTSVSQTLTAGPANSGADKMAHRGRGRPGSSSGGFPGGDGGDGDSDDDSDGNDRPPNGPGDPGKLVPFNQNTNRGTRGFIFVWGKSNDCKEVYANCLNLGRYKDPDVSRVLTCDQSLGRLIQRNHAYSANVQLYTQEGYVNGQGSIGHLLRATKICDMATLVMFVANRP